MGWSAALNLIGGIRSDELPTIHSERRKNHDCENCLHREVTFGG
jgi:hypothetical protein